MASFVGYARKHNPNPKTTTQNRESNHGGKLADDHFQRLFLQGTVMKAVVTTTITPAASDTVFGTGVVTLYKYTSDTVDGPPFRETMAAVTVYNPNTIAYNAGATIRVIDTGRFVIVLDASSSSGGGGGGSGTMHVDNYTTITRATPVTITGAEMLSGTAFLNPPAICVYTLPSASALVAAIPGVQTGTAFTINFVNVSAFSVTIGAGANSSLPGSPVAVASGNAVKFYVIIPDLVTPFYFIF